MNTKETIEKYWDYDRDYFDEYEGHISYVSNWDQTVIDYNLESDNISIFRCFSFFDDSFGEDESNRLSNIFQEAFCIFLNHNTSRKWDLMYNGDPMCSGEDIHIGFFDIPCSKEVIVEFKKLNKTFNTCFDTEEEVIEYILDDYRKNLVGEFGNRVQEEFSFSVGKYCLDDCVQVKSLFVGKEFCLIKSNDKVFNCSKKLYERVLGYMGSINYRENNFYILDDKELIICGDCCYAKIIIDLQNENNYPANLEEAYIIQKINDFSEFASGKLKGFSEYYIRQIPEVLVENKNIPLIITEGMTDWMYIDWAWKKIQEDDVLREKYKDVKFDIYRYASKNHIEKEKYPAIQMDSNTLLAMCQSYANIERGFYIFISDRDVSVNVTKMSNGDSYKKWGNGVYSFVLPIPDIRKDNPDICIEHYFSDEEIKTIKKFSDGTERRLYLSSEFDEYGRAPQINRFCTNRKACSENKLKILDGSGKDKIINLNDLNDTTNYGLSKMEFAKSVISDPAFKHIRFNNFLLIFDLIKEICKDIGL